MASVLELPQSSTPSSHHYTCLSCQVAFPTSERQRDHYRTDWHKYNLKRKVADLAPVSANQFAEKLLATQMKGQEEQARTGLVYECVVCKKSYYSENAFHNHVQSKKHKDAEEQHASEDEENEEERKMPSSATPPRSNTITDPLVECLFCSHSNADFEDNLSHMRLQHGFFLRDSEYIEDPHGLVKYLAHKVTDAICLYCNGRGKDWKSMDAVRAHMIAVGHCKMAYDESEDPEELLKYYDFGATENTPINSNKEPEQQGDELVLENGVRIGNRRSFRQYYKQQHHLAKKEEQEEEEQLMGDDTASIASLPRRERRHHHQLLISNGSEQQQLQHARTIEGTRAASAKQYEEQRYATKHNVNTLKRFRTQNPI